MKRKAMKRKRPARPKSKRRIFEVRWSPFNWHGDFFDDPLDGVWFVQETPIKVEIVSRARKADAVRAGAKYAKARAPSQLRVFTKKARIQFERTYGADPRRSPG